ncbi:MAG: hypothetical protein WAW60_00890 [Candidatus Saccharimonadales bacterium]
MKRLTQIVRIMFALFVAVFSNGIINVAAVYADKPVDETNNGTLQQVFCNELGKSGKWKAQIGGPSTEHEHPLKDNGQDVFVHDENDVTEAMHTACVDQYASEDPTAIPVPAGIADICGRANDTVPTTGTNWTIKSDGGWVADSTDLVKTVRTITYQTNEGYVFQPSEGWVLSADNTNATYTFTDWGTRCPVNLTQCGESLPIIHATNLNNNGWTSHGDVTYVDGGVKLSSPGDWKSAYIQRDMSGTLADLGDVVSYNPDINYMGLWIETSEGWLAYETIYGGNWWLDSSDASAAMIAGAPHNGGGYGSPYYGTLAEWAAAFPDLQVVSLVALYTSPTAASSTVTSVKIGCKEYTFGYDAPVRVPVKQCEEYSSNLSTNLNHNGWTLKSDAVQYVDGGIKFNVSGDWQSQWISRDITGMTLADIGTGVDFTTSNVQYFGLHVVTTDGRVLTFEKEPTYGGNWWSESEFGVNSGMGYATFDSLSNIVAANPDVQLEKLYVLYTNPESAMSTTTAVTFGCVTYTFDYIAPETPGEVLGDVVYSTTPQVLTAASTIRELPATGSNANYLLLGIVLSAATYFAVLRRQDI